MPARKFKIAILGQDAERTKVFRDFVATVGKVGDRFSVVACNEPAEEAEVVLVYLASKEPVREIPWIADRFCEYYSCARGLIFHIDESSTPVIRGALHQCFDVNKWHCQLLVAIRDCLE